jgi:LysR family transcriptional regulator, nitrogen assimilation regulatory protein
MDLKQLTYFMAIAERGSISAASTAVRIAQPALSAQISNLESELGVSLFVRHRHGMTLTSAGQTLLLHARKIVEDVRIARIATIDAAAEQSGAVVVGLPVTTSIILTVPIVEAVRRRYPKIELRMVDGMSGDIFAWLMDGRLDVGILYESDQILPLPTIPLTADDVFMIGYNCEALRGRTEISFSELANFPLFHTSRQHALRRTLDQIAHRLGFALNYVAEIDSIPQIRSLVYQGHGFAVLPKISFGDAVHDELFQFTPVRDPDVQLQSCIALTPARAPSRSAQSVAKIISEVAADLIGGNRWPGGHLMAMADRVA